MSARDYMRVLPERVPSLEAEGWRVAAATSFSGGVSVLMHRDAKPDKLIVISSWDVTGGVVRYLYPVPDRATAEALL